MAFPHRDKIKAALLDYIESRGGSVKPSEVYDPLATLFNLTEEDLARSKKNGPVGSKWPNEIQWAKFDLGREGLLVSSDQSGDDIWQLVQPLKKDKKEQKFFEIYTELEDEGVFDPANTTNARDIILRGIVQRRGQQDFRKMLLLEYNNKCSITGETCIAALEAAHIIPYNGEQTNHVQNGLLLRADLHTLFDLYLITVDSSYHINIAPSLQPSGYKYLEGKSLFLPANTRSYPSLVALEEHRSHCEF